MNTTLIHAACRGAPFRLTLIPLEVASYSSPYLYVELSMPVTQVMLGINKGNDDKFCVV